MLFNLNRRQAVFPFDSVQLNYMARKWGISNNDLTEAILQTGSLRRGVIRNYLAKKGRIFSLGGFLYRAGKKCRLFLRKLRDED